MIIKKTEIEVEINAEELKQLMPPTRPFKSATRRHYGKAVALGLIIAISLITVYFLPEDVRKEIPLKDIILKILKILK